MVLSPEDKVDYEQKYIHLKPVLETIARKYPEYGLPRIMVELRDVHHCHVNHKVVERLLGLWDLIILRSTQRKPSGIYQAILEAGKLANLVAQMEEIGLFDVPAHTIHRPTATTSPLLRVGLLVHFQKRITIKTAPSGTYFWGNPYIALLTWQLEQLVAASEPGQASSEEG